MVSILFAITRLDDSEVRSHKTHLLFAIEHQIRLHIYHKDKLPQLCVGRANRPNNVEEIGVRWMNQVCSHCFDYLRALRAAAACK